MQKKIARMVKLVKIRENSLKVEAGKLHAIQKQLVDIASQLTRVQQQYFETIDALNAERGQNPHRLRVLEDGVDCYKMRLQELIHLQKSWQDQERSQREAVLAARVEVQSFEKLADRYREEWRQAEVERDQAQQDEFMRGKSQGEAP